ncbi:MAG: class I SAM-dependent methyltransferase [Myxococcota bacterium]
MPYLKRVDALFQWIEKVNGPAWGDVLDAGTGEHSLAWLAGLPSRSLTAVTVETWRGAGLREVAPKASLVVGQWTDPVLLHGRAFDQVLVDYVIGAIDGHAPYFQYAFLERLRPHCRGRVYLVGLEPPPRDGSVLDEVCRVRDANILLAGHRTYREYPRTLVADWLARAGYRVVDEVVFPNRVGARFVNGQLDVARRKLPLIHDDVLRAAMDRHIEALRARALDLGETTWGEDYVIAAEVGL